ncbi:MAG: carbon-monoxide dehydrogenase small subunit [Rhodospirillaceae bacterium]|nr:MAG: carbon-monoxide dehydrogenase small subunit [Rhodospirillaceae bacterium]
MRGLWVRIPERSPHFHDRSTDEITEMIETADAALPTVTIALTVNGRLVRAQVEGRTVLSQLLREILGLTGTHVGCDTSHCGSCVVHMEGRAVKACTVLAVQADGTAITTIEGVARDGVLHPMQEAFRAHHALQCGFCTPGMVMMALTLGPHPDEATLRAGLAGNVCRCTGYAPVLAAVRAGAEEG